jgi:cytochrome c5
MQCNSRTTLLVIITGILLFSGFTQSYADGVNPPNTADFAQGSHDWANNCARCHNLRAPTEFTPNQWQVIIQHMRIQCGLTGREARNVAAFLIAQSATTLASSKNPQASTEGSNNAVSAAPGATVPAAAASTANNKTLKKNQNTTQAGSGLSGSVIYHQTCIACHGANGKGAIPGAPDFTSKNGPLSKSDALLLQHIENGFQTPGSPMAMPPRGGNPKLTNDDLKNALSYIRSTFGK